MNSWIPEILQPFILPSKFIIFLHLWISKFHEISTFFRKQSMCIRPCQWIWGVDPRNPDFGDPQNPIFGGSDFSSGVPPPENPPLIYGVHIQFRSGPEICPSGPILGGCRTSPQNLPDLRIPWKFAWILARNSCFRENRVFVVLTAIYLENMRRLAYIRAKMAKKRPQNRKKHDFQDFRDLKSTCCLSVSVAFCWNQVLPKFQENWRFWAWNFCFVYTHSEFSWKSRKSTFFQNFYVFRLENHRFLEISIG